jgi:hypothetical protein
LVATKNLASVITDADAQLAITIPTTVLTPTNPDTTGTGDKCSNPESAGSFMSRQHFNKIVSGLRRSNVDRGINQVHTYQELIHSNCELDSHADTCVAGPNCFVIEYTDQVTNLSSFSNELDTLQDIPIVTAATAHDNPDGTTTILILHPALYLGNKVENTLLRPNQM